MIRGLDENDAINITIGDAIKALWTDPGRKLTLILLFCSTILYFNLLMKVD